MGKMLRSLQVVLRYFLAWLAFFFVERAVFLLYFSSKINTANSGEVSKAFLFGLWMDLSTAGYFSVLPLLGFLVWWMVPRVGSFRDLFRIYFRTLLVFCALITVINFNIYQEWGSKVNRRAFEFLFSSPGEAIASSISSPLFISVLIFLFLVITGFYLSKFVLLCKPHKEGSLLLKIPVAIILLALNFLAIRGGWQLAPMNESMAYYSSRPILNHAAVNTEWALLRSLLKSPGNKNPFTFYNAAEAGRLVQQLYPSSSPDSTTRILTVNRPNIVLVILESFTSDLVGSLDGEKGITPGIESLLKQGVLFNHIYASGDRTDKGVVSVLSAFPTQGPKSIMKENAKQARLPSLFKSLSTLGYNGTFYYGGETQFANMKSYLLNTGCAEIIDKSSFEKKDMNSKWGAYDDVVYHKLIENTAQKKEPFFATLLTLTNHEPFELPVSFRFGNNTVQNKFRSTAYYTDSCLAAFINSARKQPWYKNTLFMVVADHGHRHPKDLYEIYDAHRYRIPFFLYGDVIKPAYRGTTFEKTGSQTDIAATLLAQLGAASTGYQWSKDLLNPAVSGHAFYSWENGFGFVDKDNQALTFDNTSKSIVYKTDSLNNETGTLNKAKAYMQLVYQKYLEY